MTKKSNNMVRTSRIRKVIFDYFNKEYGVILIPNVDLGSGETSMVGEMESDYMLLDRIVVRFKYSRNDFLADDDRYPGTSNYIVVPAEMTGYAIQYLRKEHKDYVGLIEVYYDGVVRTVLSPKNNFCNDYLSRKDNSNWSDEWYSRIIGPYHLCNKFERSRRLAR